MSPSRAWHVLHQACPPPPSSLAGREAGEGTSVPPPREVEEEAASWEEPGKGSSTLAAPAGREVGDRAAGQEGGWEGGCHAPPCPSL